MYIDIVPNRNSPPAVLLRESYREGKKVLKRTIANLSEVPRNIVEGLRILLRGGAAVEHFEDSFEIERSLPHGHVAAVLGTLRKLKVDTFILYLPEALRPCNPGCRSSLASYATERDVRWPWKCLTGILPIPRRSAPRSRSCAIVSSSRVWCWWEIGG